MTRRLPSLGALGATGALFVAVGLAMLVLAALSAIRSDDDERVRWVANPAAAALTLPTGATTNRAAAAAAAAAPAPAVALVIPKIGVAAPITVKSVDASGTMQNPDGAWDVAWYDFSSQPGGGGNVVLSGHFDYVNVGPAVFWGLRRLEEGDVVQVELADGRRRTYVVFESGAYDAGDAPVQAIVGPTAEERLTLITCDGRFNARLGTYDERLIVRARPL